jgi:TetR/AcrR family transcriptional repressor of nem operon
MERWGLSLAAGLGAMGERGELVPGADPAELATQTLALLQGGLLLTQIHRDPTQIRLAADGALSLICSALVPASPTP